MLLASAAFAFEQDNDQKGKDKKKGHHKGDQAQLQQSAQFGGKSEKNHNEREIKNAGTEQSRRVSKHEEKVQSFTASPMVSQSYQSGGQRQSKHRSENRNTSSQQNFRTNTGGALISGQSYQPNRVQSSQRTQIEVSSNQRSYTKTNHYGGLWFPENSHHDWNRSGDHYYNSHHYRWYEGGWLIIDAGYNPYDESYTDGRMAQRVQARLAERGYYRGPVDGDIGPGTRRAIADYQSDHDLRVTGRINEPLLIALRLE